MAQRDVNDERKAGYRESGRAVAVALLGFTLQAVSVLPSSDASADTSRPGFMAFKECLEASFEELSFIAAAGDWAESLAFPNCKELQIQSILTRLDHSRVDIDRTRLGLAYLAENYRTAVLQMAQRLLEKKFMNGTECGQIILAHRPPQGQALLKK